MIRMIQSTSARHAKSYFSDALTRADYFLNDQELQGQFKGCLAERLKLKGKATKEAFFALCENKNPNDSKPLTPRMKEKRITGYDINFHCPKSVSILHALSKDHRILHAFEECVTETMKDIEADSKTRIRKDGVYDDRKTGELIWAEFIHQTARPVEDQLPDPHLHCHCFVFNATWDDNEKKIKAGKFRDIKRDMPYYQARFHKRLADKIVELGYQIKPTSHSFEVEIVPKEVIQHFSKRTNAIGKIAKEQDITNRKELDALGAKTRAKKQKGFGMKELKDEWRKQIKSINAKTSIENNNTITYTPQKENKELNYKDCIDYALQHCFERASVMTERKILETAYRHALGQRHVSIDDLTFQFYNEENLLRISQGSQMLCTTKEVLAEEKRMVDLAKNGQGKMLPLYKYVPDLDLKEQQAAAVSHVLTTNNRVSIIRGVAGAGKTTLLQKLVPLIEDTGRKVISLAPSAQASRGTLKEEGFKEAETVALFLIDENLQKNLKDQVILVDEAGLLGTKDTLNLLEIATKNNARLILVGDTRQHASVVRGDALRILNTVAGIKSAEVSEIQRQQNFQYKSIVEDLSKGKIKNAFEQLDSMGAIRKIDPMNPHEELVNDYIEGMKKKKSVLVISPTHDQGEETTDEIRKKMRHLKMIGKKEIDAIKYSNLNMTEAERSDWRNYEPGQVVQFNQNMKRIKRGSLWTVENKKDKDVYIRDEQGKTLVLPRHKVDRFNVFEKSEIGLSKGDKIRITQNGFDIKKKRMNNGTMLEVVSVNKKGKILLRNKASKTSYLIDKDYGHIAHAYCITSHASQGKTVDQVLISQPASTFGATNAKQFYVSVSRGREAVKIFTDDPEALLDAASELSDRQSAIELVQAKNGHLEKVIDKQRSEYDYRIIPVQEQKELLKKISLEKDYEPEF